MKRTGSAAQIARLTCSLVMLISLLLPTTAFAQGKSNGNQKNDPPPQAQQKKDDDKKAQASAQQSAQTQSSTKSEQGSTDTQPIDTPCEQTQSRHPSGNDRCVENGVSGTQGKSTSDPDHNGKGPERNAVGDRTPDKPGGQGGVIRSDQDGNNGCGNDQDFEDDNEGWCGGKPKKANEQPTPKPTPPGEVRGETKVHVVGCYEWKDSGERFFIDKEMSEHEAKEFDKSTNRISDSMEGCKTPPPAPKLVHIEGCFKDMGEVDKWLPEDEAEVFLDTHERVKCEDVKGDVDEHPNSDHGKVPICHRTGSMSNPWVLIEVSVNAQGHVDHDKFDIHPEDKIFWNGLPSGFTEAMCGTPPVNTTNNSPTLHSFEGCVKVANTYQKVSLTGLTENEKKSYESIKVDMLKCEGTQGSTDNTPNPPTATPTEAPKTTDTSNNPSPVTLYGCFRKPDGTYQHYNMTFNTQAEKDAFERDNGLTVDASRPNPEQCVNPTPQPTAQPTPQPTAQPTTQPTAQPTPQPTAQPTTQPSNVLGVVDVSGNPPPPIVITTSEARELSPVVDIFPPAGELGIVSEQPAAPAAPAVNPAPQPAPQAAPQAAPQPLTTLLPTTGQPLVDLALLTLGFVALTFLGLRFLRVGRRI